MPMARSLQQVNDKKKSSSTHKLPPKQLENYRKFSLRVSIKVPLSMYTIGLSMRYFKGSVDASIKVLDVERMLVKSAAAPGEGANDTIQQQMETHPVIRTLYDHIEEVTCLAFHPR